MRRKLILFVCVLGGCYLGLGLYVRAVSARQKQTLEQENRMEALHPHDPPLLTAVAGGSAIEMTHLLQTGANTEGRDRAGHTPLLIAARAGDPGMVQKLLAAGAQVNAQDSTNKSALIYAIEAGCDPSLVMLLLAHGADANHQDREGETAFTLACDLADTRLMKPLLAHGAKVNLPDKLGQTPLIHVANGMVEGRLQDRGRRGLIRLSALQLLLQYRADVRLRDKRGLTALLYASEYNPSEALQMLLQHGADPNIKGAYGQTPLSLAASQGLVGNLQVLLANGAKGGKDNLNEALLGAAANGHDAAVQFLLDRGADINTTRNRFGRTPLMMATSNGRTTTANLLLQRGANPGLQAKSGKSAPNSAPAGRGNTQTLSRGVNPLSASHVEGPEDTPRYNDKETRP